MIKSIFGVLIMIIVCSCNSNNHTVGGRDFAPNALKDSIKKIAKANFSNTSIYAVRVTKLYRNTIISIEPVYYNDYLNECGIPADMYLYETSLFLFYCGIETINNYPNSFKDEIQKQFDVFCLQHGIGANKNKVHDILPLFFKVQDSSFVPFNKGNEKCFYNSFFEVEEVTPLFKSKSY